MKSFKVTLESFLLTWNTLITNNNFEHVCDCWIMQTSHLLFINCNNWRMQEKFHQQNIIRNTP